jgi:hypothetical protein
VHRALDVHRGHQPRPGHHLFPDRLANCRAAVLGSWIHYGLGSVNQNLPAFIVLVTPHKSDQPLYARLWGSGFLDARYQGIQFRSGKEPILYMSDPDGPCGSGRRALLDKLNALNRLQFEKELDPEIESRIAQYEWPIACKAACRK